MTDWKREHDAELGLRQEWSARAQQAEAVVAALRAQHLEALRIADHWMIKHDKLLGFIQARPAMLKELIEETQVARYHGDVDGDGALA